MSRTRLMMLLVGCVAALSITFGLRSDFAAAQPDGAPTPEQMQAIMEAAIAAAQPGEAHKRLDVMAGTFDVTIRAFGPDGSVAMEEKAQTVNRWILGGRFLECDAKSESPQMQIESKMIVGFDRRAGKEHYFAFGIDTMGTYAIDPTGTWDTGTNELVLEGTTFEPMMGGDQAYRMVFSFPSDDRYVSDLYLQVPGRSEPMKMFQMDHRRTN